MLYGMNESEKTCYRLEDFFRNKLQMPTVKIFLAENMP